MGVFGQRTRCRPAVAVKKAKLDLLGIGRMDGHVYAGSIGGAERIG